MTTFLGVIHELRKDVLQFSVPIMVWKFHDAPKELQSLSNHGGDEDWLALVPPYLAGAWIPWIDGGSFGVCDVSEHELPDGSVVFIGAHA